MIGEEKVLTIAQLQKATSRRSRKDEEGRDFQCGCGKRYLSYPALYTHIKTKHDGRQPEGTQKTGTNMATKRIKGKIQDLTLKNINNYLQKEDLKLLKQLDESMIGQVSLYHRIKKQAVPRQIYDCYMNMVKQQPNFKISKHSSLDLVLTVYLINVGQYVNDKLFDHYLIFAKIIRNCYSEYGEQVYKNCFSKKEGELGYIQSFACSQVRYFPIICDFVTRYYIPYSQSAKQFKDTNLSLIELMLYDFCKWLLKKNLTFINVELKKEYKLEVKPVPLQKAKNMTKHQAAKSQRNQDEESNSMQEKKQNYMEFEQQSLNQDAEEDIVEAVSQQLAKDQIKQIDKLQPNVCQDQIIKKIDECAINDQKQKVQQKQEQEKNV